MLMCVTGTARATLAKHPYTAPRLTPEEVAGRLSRSR